MVASDRALDASITPPSRRPHVIGLDGIRGIAALAVLIGHVHGETTVGTDGFLGKIAGFGGQGLTLFFALSGFLLFGPYVAAILDGRPLPSIRRYLTNRGLRIFPAYWVILTVVAFVLGAAYIMGTPGIYGEGPDNIGYLTDPGKIAANYLLLQTFIPGMVVTGIGPAWSLTTELTFYALLPALAVGAAALVRRGWSARAAVLAPAVLLIAVGLSTTVVLRFFDTGDLAFYWGQTWTAVIDRSILAQGDLFGYGMLAAVAFALFQRRGLPAPRGGGLVIAILVLVVAAAGLKFGGWLSSNIVGIAAGLLILGTVLPRRGSGANQLARTLEIWPIRSLGLISYSVYLWHLPVMWWLKQHGFLMTSGQGGLAYNILLVGAIVIVLATITYLAVERPAMRLRARISHRRTPASSH